MSETRYHVIPILLVTTSTLLVWGTAFAVSAQIGTPMQWVLFGAGIPALCAIFWFRRERSAAESDLEADRKALAEERKALEAEKEKFQHARKAAEAELEKHSVLIQKREAALSQKLTTFHEWMEFPTGIGENREPLPEAGASGISEADQAVLKLIQEKTELIFNKIREKDYLENGIFRRERLVDDLFDLMESVARIYNPASENPLLETSVEQLLRAANRIALQLIVVLEQLPLDLKTYNFRKVYDSVQAGVRVYDVYKTVDPYWNYLRPVYYLGRFALGTNPITLGVGWAVGELAKTGAKKLSSHLANRYALNLLHDLIFIVGNEAAGIFGGDFRHREPNWIYGAELSELISRFPISREIMESGLNEVGHLRLRNEYDRIFLYRCLAAHKSAGPRRFDARSHLSPEERQTIADRLERFSNRYICGKPGDLEAWKSDVEDRLEVKIRVDAGRTGPDAEYGMAEGLRSLAAFLLDFKKQSSEALPGLLATTRLFAKLDGDHQQKAVRQLTESPPMIFDYPDLEPSDPLLDDYIHDLMRLCVRVYPPTIQADYMVESAARYFRRKDAKDLTGKMGKMYSGFLAENLISESPEKKLKPHVARALLGLPDAGEMVRFVYEDVKVQTDVPLSGELWLMGTDRRLLLALIPDEKEAAVVIWQGTDAHPVRMEKIEKRFNIDCRLRGGVWLAEAFQAKTPDLILPGQTMTRYGTYFKALAEYCGENI
ncbi:hypothetical protein DENIS_2071 [Desulfonema ishimotonii]|uniref:Uncharacterized protein n=1 Tax=Desulfonema ishimotonii TaxID=45657 RepID=A0A401FVW9_9BACT|nr:hypothetical protein [Desulfonema ishimotonii]GBC61111.1 hypothetical protein DENIS_2071 [Desulfonema ishimotonii]